MKYWRLSGVEVVRRAASAYLARLVFSILKDFYLACMKCWVPPPNPIKLDMVAHICDSRSEEVEQKDQEEFKVIFNDIASLRPSWATQDPATKTNKKVKARVEITRNYV